MEGAGIGPVKERERSRTGAIAANRTPGVRQLVLRPRFEKFERGGWRFVVRVVSVSLRICTSKFIARAARHVSLIMHVCERDTRRSWKSPGNKLDACQPGSSESGNQCPPHSRPFWWDSVSSGSLELSALSLSVSPLFVDHRNAIHVTICVRVWKLMSRTRKSFVGPLTSTWLVINFFDCERVGRVGSKFRNCGTVDLWTLFYCRILMTRLWWLINFFLS